MRNLLIFLAVCCLFSACGKSNADKYRDDAFNARVQSAPEFAEIDADLDALEAETADLEKNYDDIQSRVLAGTNLSESQSFNVSQIVINVNENNVLIVNDKAMSKNDFSNFLDRSLPGLCNPSPRLSIDKKADYDIAAWALEAIYARGCTNVDIE